MSQKKCPKCGEMNPPEAVMCWACYTPLTGGAASSSGSSTSSSPVVGDSGSGAKKSITPVQMGGVAAVLLVLGVGAKLMLGSGGGDDDSVSAPAAPDKSNDAPATPAATAAPKSNIPAAPAPAAISTTPTVGQPEPAPYTIISVPNARYTFGTMAILLNKPSATPREAATIAAYVRQKMMQNKKWKILHIYVFTDKQAAAEFRIFQSRRKGAPLDPKDYQSLLDVWANAPVRYEFNRGYEGVLWPSRSPTNWWTVKPTYAKVTQQAA